MLLSESLSFNIFFDVPFDKVANLAFGHRRSVCIYRPHFVFVLTDAAFFFIGQLKENIPKKNYMFQKYRGEYIFLFKKMILVEFYTKEFTNIE